MPKHRYSKEILLPDPSLDQFDYVEGGGSYPSTQLHCARAIADLFRLGRPSPLDDFLTECDTAALKDMAKRYSVILATRGRVENIPVCADPLDDRVLTIAGAIIESATTASVTESSDAQNNHSDLPHCGTLSEVYLVNA